MPQVPGAPYEPYPSVMPAERILRPMGIPSVPDAYGVGVARAIHAFGGDVQEAGKDVFGAALKLRELEVDRQVRDGITDLVDNHQAPLDQKFLANVGDQVSSAALTDHLSQLDQNKKDKVAQLQAAGVGPYGIDKFNNEYASYERNFATRAIGHSATEAKTADKASLHASNISDLNVLAASKDDGTFNTYLGSTPGRAQRMADAEGLGDRPEVVKEFNTRLTGLAWDTHLRSIARDDPDRAQQLFKTIKNTDLGSNQQGRPWVDVIDDHLNRELRTRAFEQKQIRALDVQNAKDQALADVSAAYAKNAPSDPQTGLPVPTANYMRDMHRIGDANPYAMPLVKEYTDWGLKLQNANEKGLVPRTDGNALSVLTGSMFDPNRPTSELDVIHAENEALSGRAGIDHKTGDWLRTMIKLRDSQDAATLKNPFFQNAMNSAKLLIEGTGRGREMNAANFAAFQFQFTQDYLNKVRDKKLEPNDLDIRNADGLLRKAIDPYVPGIGQMVIQNGGVGSPRGTPSVAPPVTATAPAPSIVSPATAAPAPSVAPTPPPPASVTIGSKAEYDKLAPGTSFIYRGKPFTKPRGGPPERAEPPQATM